MNATDMSAVDPFAEGSPVHIWWRKFTLATVCILYVLVALTLAGNGLTIAAVVKFRNLRRRRYMLITSLAVTDVLVGAAWGFFILAEVDPQWCSSVLGNTIELMVTTYPTLVSHLHALLMAIDRAIAVMAPFRYIRWMSRNRIKLAITSVWIVASIYVLTMLPWGWYYTLEECSYNQFSQAYAVSTQLVLYISAVCTMIVMYTRIKRTVKLQAEAINALSAVPTVQQLSGSFDDTQTDKTKRPNANGHSVSTYKATRYMVVVVGAYLATWTLYFLLGLIGAISPLTASYSITWHVLLRVAFFLMLLNSCINILIYAAYITEFRTAYKDLLSCASRKNTVTPLA